MKRALNGIMKVLLPVIFTGYIGVMSFYTHVHVVDGVRIVHSHPFKKSLPGQPLHSHSSAEFQLIKSVTSFSLTPDVVAHFEWKAVGIAWVKPLTASVTVFFRTVAAGVLSLRAPPFVL